MLVVRRGLRPTRLSGGNDVNETPQVLTVIRITGGSVLGLLEYLNYDHANLSKAVTALSGKTGTEEKIYLLRKAVGNGINRCTNYTVLTEPELQDKYSLLGRSEKAWFFVTEKTPEKLADEPDPE